MGRSLLFSTIGHAVALCVLAAITFMPSLQFKSHKNEKMLKIRILDASRGGNGGGAPEGGGGGGSAVQAAPPEAPPTAAPTPEPTPVTQPPANLSKKPTKTTFTPTPAPEPEITATPKPAPPKPVAPKPTKAAATTTPKAKKTSLPTPRPIPTHKNAAATPGTGAQTPGVIDATPKPMASAPVFQPLGADSGTPVPGSTAQRPGPPGAVYAVPGGTGGQGEGPGLESFDDEGIYLPPYFASNLRLAIRRNFIQARGQKANARCTVTFTVTKGGDIKDPQIQTSTGNPILDNIAISALTKTRNVMPLPDTFPLDQIRFLVPFDFTME